MQRRHLVQLCAAALAATALGAQAQTSDFPVKPIKLVIAFPAGGPTDITMRALADNAGRILGQPVIVENKPGAGGTLPAQTLQSSAADGYTVGQIPLGVFRLPYTTKINWDPIKDITYVINVTGYAFGIVVPAASPLKNWADFVAWAKANPGKLSYGSTGTMTSPHLTTELIAQQAGIELLHVPYKGSADLMQSILGGNIMAAADSTGFAPQVEAGKLRVLTPGALSAWPSSRMRPRSKSWASISCRTRRSASARPRAHPRRWSSACTTRSSKPWSWRATKPRWPATTWCRFT